MTKCVKGILCSDAVSQVFDQSPVDEAALCRGVRTRVESSFFYNMSNLLPRQADEREETKRTAVRIRGHTNAGSQR